MLDTLKYRTRQVYSAAKGVGIAALALVALQSEARAQAPTETKDRNRAAISASFDAWRAGTGGPFELLADDARWTIEGNSVAAKTYPTKEDFMREVIRPFNARMKTPLRPAVRSLYADGDTVVVFFDARATAIDGKPYINTYAWFLDMRAGRIVRASAFFDAIEFNDLWARVKPALAAAN